MKFFKFKISALAFLALLTFSTTGCDGNNASAFVSPSTKAKTVEAEPTDTTNRELTFALVGDVMPGTTFPDSTNHSHLPANNGLDLFDNCKAILTSAHVACLNLEGTLLDNGGQRRKMTNPNTYYIFRIPTRYTQALTEAGFDFAGIANNHINDFGQAGRTSTVKALAQSSLAHSGLKGINEIGVIERNEFKIAIAQFGHGDNNLDINKPKELERIIALMDSMKADIKVIAFHGGAEGAKFTHLPFAPEVFVGEKRGNVTEFAHRAIDLGAHLVYGHGPHVPRAMELYKGHLIVYSLGNFCTPFRMSMKGPAGLAPLITATINKNGKLLRGKIHSFIQVHGSGPRRDPANKAALLIKALTESDFPEGKLAIDAEGNLEPVR